MSCSRCYHCHLLQSGFDYEYTSTEESRPLALCRFERGEIAAVLCYGSPQPTPLIPSPFPAIPPPPPPLTHSHTQTLSRKENTEQPNSVYVSLRARISYKIAYSSMSSCRGTPEGYHPMAAATETDRSVRKVMPRPPRGHAIVGPLSHESEIGGFEFSSNLLRARCMYILQATLA